MLSTRLGSKSNRSWWIWTTSRSQHTRKIMWGLRKRKDNVHPSAANFIPEICGFQAKANAQAICHNYRIVCHRPNFRHFRHDNVFKQHFQSLPKSNSATIRHIDYERTEHSGSGDIYVHGAIHRQTSLVPCRFSRSVYFNSCHLYLWICCTSARIQFIRWAAKDGPIGRQCYRLYTHRLHYYMELLFVLRHPHDAMVRSWYELNFFQRSNISRKPCVQYMLLL